MATNLSVSGNIAVAPELIRTEAGVLGARFVVAENDRYRDKTSGEWVDGEAIFWPVTAWGALGENLAVSVKVGDRVTVTGRAKANVWTTDSGEKRSRTEVVAEDVAASMRWARVDVTKVRTQTPVELAEATPPF